MDRVRFNRDTSRESKGSVTLQKKLAMEAQRKTGQVPDLIDFMNDMFFGTVNVESSKKVYNLTGGGGMDEDYDFESSTRSNSSRQTQEWLEEAKRMVASSPSRSETPPRFIGSPRFVAAHGSPSLLDQRDPLSRSARRNRAVESFSGEILSKSAKAKHSRNTSFDNLDTTTTTTTTTTTPTPSDSSPASAVQKWFSNILKPSNNNPTPPSLPSTPDPPTPNQTLPPRQLPHRKSRFQTDPSSPGPQGIPTPSRLNNSTPTLLPDSPVEKQQQQQQQQQQKLVLSPPRNLVESAHRRSISSSTCSLNKIAPKLKATTNVGEEFKEEEEYSVDDVSLNGFLKQQRIKVKKLLNGELNAKAQIVLSGPSNSTSSIVAAICYAWLLENRMSNNKNKGEGDGVGSVVVPVINVRRRRMWKQRQAAWLLYHVGVDATSLLFADEVNLESLMMAGQLSIVVVGQDILRTNSEVGSQCTVLTDNYCEDAYDLLQTPVLKKLLLAGILLDTQNLKTYDKSSMTRDSEAVQLLLVGSAPSYRYSLYDQLKEEQRDKSFLESLQHNYGKPPNENDLDCLAHAEHRVLEKKPTSASHPEDIIHNSDNNPSNAGSAKTNRVSPKTDKPSSLPVKAPSAAPAQKAPDNSHGKNKFFLAKWLGFGSNKNK